MHALAAAAAFSSHVSFFTILDNASEDRESAYCLLEYELQASDLDSFKCFNFIIEIPRPLWDKTNTRTILSSIKLN